MSRLGGAGAVAPLVTDIPLSSVEVINYSTKCVVGTILLLSPDNLSNIVLIRKKEVRVEETNQPGRSGRTMARKDR